VRIQSLSNADRARASTLSNQNDGSFSKFAFFCAALTIGFYLSESRGGQLPNKHWLDGMDEITREWFSSARERYSGAVRFAFLLLAVLFGIQLTTFTEYLDTQARLRRAKAQADEARALSATMSEVARAADALQQTVTGNLKELLDRLVEELKGDFAALDAKVAGLRGGRPVPSEPRGNLAIQTQRAWTAKAGNQLGRRSGSQNKQGAEHWRSLRASHRLG
jgi:hypothetical protein